MVAQQARQRRLRKLYRDLLVCRWHTDGIPVRGDVPAVGAGLGNPHAVRPGRMADLGDVEEAGGQKLAKAHSRDVQTAFRRRLTIIETVWLRLEPRRQRVTTEQQSHERLACSVAVRLASTIDWKVHAKQAKKSPRQISAPGRARGPVQLNSHQLEAFLCVFMSLRQLNKQLCIARKMWLTSNQA